MQPQQPVYPSPAPNMQPANDPYQFIVNPEKPGRKKLLPAGNSLVGRVLLVVGGIFVLAIIFVVVKNLLGGSETINKASLINVAADQTELIHLSTGGFQDAVSQNTKNFAITTELSITSQEAQLISYLKSHNVKGSTKQLDIKQSATIDSQLAAAQAASTFDPTFTSVMQSGLATYQTDLKQAYTLNPGPKARALLNADYTGATLLAKQLGSAAS